jgi:hypothetical protein
MGPYMQQIRFVFKRLIQYNIIIDARRCVSFCARVTVGDGLRGLAILYN